MTKFNLTDSTLLLEIIVDNELLVPFPESNEYRKDEWHLAGVKKRSAQRPNTQKKYTGRFL